ncbi:TadE/TadG family type IV pilus assembly protein [Microvirga sp. G4-2]|uniref:TadE/TadG family type IV pilus assembly protein n=1 Tax=Microvirga sp. G4-2 TaxID=3434467 RepID=UPI004044F6F0
MSLFRLSLLRVVFRRFAEDTRGAALILFTIMAPVIIGMVALAIDFSRYMQLNTELRDLADAAALAGAKELDGAATAMTRAENAAKFVLNNNPRWADSNEGLQISQVRFYSKLDPDTIASSDADAAFIEVTTATRTLTGWFIGAVSADKSNDTAGRAVAGTTYVACEVTPLRICFSNPTEFNPPIGTQFLLRANGSGLNQNGDFAIVDPPNDTNGSRRAINLGSPKPNFCFSNGNTVTPGNAVSQVCEGMNVRFDIYPNGGGPAATQIKSFPPAPNVLKGNPSLTCNGNSGPANQLPRDSAFTDGWYGNANWKGTAFDNYLAYNHADKTQSFRDLLKTSTTRYQVYLRELGLDLDANGNITPRTAIPSSEIQQSSLSGTMPAPGGNPANPVENPYPTKYFSNNGEDAATSLDPERRIFYVAIVNCDANQGNATPPRRTNRYAKFFMTEPVSPPNAGGALYAEYVGMIKPDDGSGIMHELVQLYR